MSLNHTLTPPQPQANEGRLEQLAERIEQIHVNLYNLDSRTQSLTARLFGTLSRVNPSKTTEATPSLPLDACNDGLDHITETISMLYDKLSTLEQL